MVSASEMERCICTLSDGQVYEFEAFDLQYCMEKCCMEYRGVNYVYLQYSEDCLSTASGLSYSLMSEFSAII
jgi:hypothetical protein